MIRAPARVSTGGHHEELNIFGIIVTSKCQKLKVVNGARRLEAMIGAFGRATVLLDGVSSSNANLQLGSSPDSQGATCSATGGHISPG